MGPAEDVLFDAVTEEPGVLLEIVCDPVLDSLLPVYEPDSDPVGPRELLG